MDRGVIEKRETITLESSTVRNRIKRQSREQGEQTF